MSPLGRRLAILVVALVVAAGCGLAGAWQWDRHVTRSAAVATLRANADAAPLSLDQLVQPGTSLPQGDTWRPARAIGHYLPDATVLLRNRPVGGRPAIGVLEVFVLTEGDLAGMALVVHRGWVPPDDDVTEAVPVPSPPDGEVELVVRLRPSERASDRVTPPGRVYAIAVDKVITASGTAAVPVVGAYGVLVTEAGAPPSDVRGVPLPDTGFGPHLSYALQWWFFAVGALVGAVVLIRRDSEQDRGDHPPRRPRRRSAEEEEDASVEAAGATAPA